MSTNWWQDSLQDAVRFQALERLDLVDAQALQRLVYQSSMESVGAIMGKGSGCLTKPQITRKYSAGGGLSGTYTIDIGAFQFYYSYPARRSTGDIVDSEQPATATLAVADHSSLIGDGYGTAYADDATQEDQTIYSVVDGKTKAWKGVVVTHDPSDPSQSGLSTIDVSVLLQGMYAAWNAGTTTLSEALSPYIWARPVLVDSDTDARREWNVTSGAESAISINTRQRVRVEFQLSSTEPTIPVDGSGNPTEPPYVRVGRILGHLMSERLVPASLKPDDPLIWWVSAWDDLDHWKATMEPMSGHASDPEITLVSALSNTTLFPVQGDYSTGTSGNVSTSMQMMMGTLDGTSDSRVSNADDPFDQGLIKLLHNIRFVLRKHASSTDTKNWAEETGHGLAELTGIADKLWDIAGADALGSKAVAASDTGFIPKMLGEHDAITKMHTVPGYAGVDLSETEASNIDGALGLTAGHPIAWARMVWVPAGNTHPNNAKGSWFLLNGHNVELKVGAVFSRGIQQGGSGGPVNAADTIHGKVELAFTKNGAAIFPTGAISTHSISVMRNKWTGSADPVGVDVGRRWSWGHYDPLFDYYYTPAEKAGGGWYHVNPATAGVGTLTTPSTHGDYKNVWKNIYQRGFWGGFHPTSGIDASGSIVVPGETLPVAHLGELDVSGAVTDGAVVYVQGHSTMWGKALPPTTPQWPPDLTDIGTSFVNDAGTVMGSWGILGPLVPTCCSFDIVFFRHEPNGTGGSTTLNS
jgi:hypothetical protein